ncbi:MAG: cyanophycin synthetase [Cytophagales bacterium]|nr:cyanophycin synthetase [Cytophagales bacterium]
MKILEIKAMRGPNYWSVRRHKLIVMRLDLEDMDHRPTNKIRGFYGRLKKMLPGLYEHRCSPGKPGGFFQRVKKGTWMGHVIEHISLEIQSLAGMECGFGRTRSTGEPGIYNVVFSYMEEKVGRYAAKASVSIAEALTEGTEYDLEGDIQAMREIREDERLGPSTGSIVQEAISRGIPYIRMNNQSFVQLGYGINQRRIRATITSQTSDIAVEIACDKEETKDLLQKANIPVAKGAIITTQRELKKAVKHLGYPLVTKPVDGHQGKGATINITNWDEAVKGFVAAGDYSIKVVIEKFVTGFDFRLLVINYKFVAAALRTPAHVEGDGKSSIQQLIDKVNKDPRRGYGHENVLTEIRVDEMTKNILNIAGRKLDSVLPKGEQFYLKTTANLSTGGTATDVSDTVHPYNIFMAERIARIIGLDICGIDIMAPDLTMPVNENGGAILEVNAAPGFRMHLAPTEGLPRNVAEPVIDMLYPQNNTATIPIITVTGTNGKTTTVRLIAHILKTVDYKVGFTTTDGIYIQNRMLEVGDCTGPRSAEFVLKDPTVNFAVLECARGGILRAGLGFLRCDAAVVTNIAGADHLGLKDIHTAEEMARVKSVVPETVFRNGYAILNADDDLVFGMKKNLDCKIALFSMDEKNPRIKKHCNDGGLATIVENGYITICKGNWKIRVDKVVNIPLTFSGKAIFNIQNILPAVLAGFVRNIKIEDIRVALQTFIPSPAQTPGRMNFFQFKEFEVLVDFAHNTEGFKALGKFLEKVETSPKIGIIAGVGDRRDEDLIELGALSARMYDEIIIRCDKNLRGRPVQELIDLLVEGIHSQDNDKPWKAIPNELEAIAYALKNAPKGSLNIICSDTIPEALDLVKKLKEEEDKFVLTKADIS